MATTTLVVLVLALCLLHSNATLILSNTIGTNMVLQRAPLSANIFGWADVGDVVTVTFNNQEYVSKAASDGSWLVTLPPTPAGGPYGIGITTSAGDKILLQNILFGDVWVCGGQSNMEFTVQSAFNASAEVAAANNYPNIRVFSVGQGNYSSEPLSDLAKYALSWSQASSATIGAGNWTYFSAVCWFTGRDLYDTYNVPLGLISSNWGGTYIQAWSTPAALKSCNVNTSFSGNEANSVLYNAMIYPFAKTSIKGVLWYQGEQNWDQAQLYTCMFPAMINSWRSTFTYSPSFTFLFVQLAAWVAGTGTYIPDVRQAQLAAMALPGVGYATATDLGDTGSPWGSVHPRYKQEVGARLALAARNIAYGETKVVWQGPTFHNASVASITDNTATVEVSWNFYGPGSFTLKNASCPSACPNNQCSNWAYFNGTEWSEVQVVSLTWNNDNVVSVEFSIAAGSPIKGIRYGYAAWPLLTLYSEQELPAIPFETFL